jgi:uncharacterized membrane protein
MWQWLRRNFLAGLLVTIPLVVTVAALVWIVRLADRLTRPLGTRLFGELPPGSIEYSAGFGIVVTVIVVLAVGVFATNVLGRRLVGRVENALMHVPVFRTVYGPVKQILAAFAPDNESGFKRVVVVEDPARGAVLGFLTREFMLERVGGPEPRLAVYVPTNHLYLGDVLICRPEQVSFPDLTIEEGVRVFLTGGVGLPDRLALKTTSEVVSGSTGRKRPPRS